MIFKLIVLNISLGIHCEFAPRLMPQNLNNEKSTLVQVMAWGHQVISHYLNIDLDLEYANLCGKSVKAVLTGC